MGDPKGFLTTPRQAPTRRPVDLRLKDWHEVYEEFPDDRLERQAGRCMNCGIPFCHQGCPLGNLIPEWNDLVYRDEWREAIERLHATNNFPEFTGTLCPAPCEAACVLGDQQRRGDDQAGRAADHRPRLGTRLGRPAAARPRRPARRSPSSGRARRGWPPPSSSPGSGHDVTVFERADRIGGLLRYGIPEFKMEKSRLDRRLDQMEAEGTVFRPGVNVGTDVTVEQLRTEFDAVVLAGGATAAATCPLPGREFNGIHQAMEYLPWANRVQQGDLEETPITAEGKHVVIVGGGDTGADCLGTAHRQGAASVTQLEIMPTPAGEADRAHAVADLPDGLPGGLGARGGRRAALRGEHRRVHRRRRRQRRDAEARGGRPATRRAASCRWRAPSTRSRRSSCCWPWASSGRRRAR